jgi:nitrous oxide reductase
VKQNQTSVKQKRIIKSTLPKSLQGEESTHEEEVAKWIFQNKSSLKQQFENTSSISESNNKIIHIMLTPEMLKMKTKFTSSTQELEIKTDETPKEKSKIRSNDRRLKKQKDRREKQYLKSKESDTVKSSNTIKRKEKSSKLKQPT